MKYYNSKKLITAITGGYIKLQLFHTLSHEKIVRRSALFPVENSKIYEWNIPYSLILGNDNSVFAGLQFYNSDLKGVVRRYKFFKNHSGNEQTLTLRCYVPYGAKSVRLLFRINCDGATPSDVKIKLPEIEQCSLNQTTNSDESYDDIFDYVKKYEETDLDKEPWKAIGGKVLHRDGKKYHNRGLAVCKQFGLTPNSSVLDIGCGTGAMVNTLKPFLSSPKNYVGTDLVMKSVEFCKKQYPEFEFHKNESTKLPNLNRNFDMIFLFSVFTHMYPNEIKELLIDIKKYLKNDGSIVCTVNINPYITSHIGTRNRIEMTKKYFFDIAKSAGYSRIEVPIIERQEGLQSICRIQH
jgi:ubiquinone/menaquinone biosynthesis C-methylase UbiE